MKKKYVLLSLGLLVCAVSLVAEEPAASDDNRRKLSFEQQENIGLMDMLAKLLRSKDSDKIAMLIPALAAAERANLLRLAALEEAVFDAQAQELVREMMSFFELLGVVRSVVEESLQKSSIIDLKNDYKGRSPFLIQVLDMSQSEQEKKLATATSALRKEVIFEVAAVLEVLMHNLKPATRKKVKEMIREHLAARKKAAEEKEKAPE